MLVDGSCLIRELIWTLPEGSIVFYDLGFFGGRGSVKDGFEILWVSGEVDWFRCVSLG